MQQEIEAALYRNWIWVDGWEDCSKENTAGRLVSFTHRFHLDNVPDIAIIHCTADTRYKLLINGSRITVGPSRSSPERWLYDSVDIAPFLVEGPNLITFIVLRYFYATRAALPFVRTGFPGLTVTGKIGEHDISTAGLKEWQATVDRSTHFPIGLPDDVFLHVSPPRDSG